jgi:TolA-binding protein
MAHRRKALVTVLVACLCLSAPLLGAQSASAASDLKEGIDLFRSAQYDKAILLFHNVILDPTADDQKAQAYFLIAKSYMAVGKLDDAEHNLEFYLATYPKGTDYPEALYQKGRLLFLQDEYENAIQAIQGFVASYPRNPLVSSAWFWAGECLYSLGRLDDALAVYQKILSDYPTSIKVEASQYKVSLIQLQKKEQELSKLLKWSHEDFLRTVEDFQNRERTYQQAIEAYQRRLAGAGQSDDQKTIADLQSALAAKTDQANKLTAEVARLTAQASASTAAASTASAAPVATDTPTVPTSAADAAAADARRLDLDKRERLLVAKEQALALKEIYLNWLQENGGADQ